MGEKDTVVEFSFRAKLPQPQIASVGLTKSSAELKTLPNSWKLFLASEVHLQVIALLIKNILKVCVEHIWIKCIWIKKIIVIVFCSHGYRWSFVNHSKIPAYVNAV